MSKKPPARPMGIMASFSNVAFKKDGAEIFSARVHSGGCFGPDATDQVIDRGYAELNDAIKSGKLPETARDFNTVSVGMNDYTVTKITPAHVEVSKLGRRNP